MNPGFESGATVTGHSQLHFATGWDHTPPYYGSTSYSTDLFEVGGPCASSGAGGSSSLGVPSNKWSSNLPSIGGNRYAGGSGISPASTTGEACVGTLTDNLVACDNYKVEFYHAPGEAVFRCNPASSWSLPRYLNSMVMHVTLRNSAQPSDQLVIGQVPLTPQINQWDQYFFTFSLTELQAATPWDRIEFIVRNTVGPDVIYFLDNVSLENQENGPCDQTFDACITGGTSFCEGEQIIMDGSCSDFHNRHFWNVYDASNGWNNRGPAIIGPIWGIEPGDHNTANQAGQLDLTGLLSANPTSEKCYYVELGIQKWCCGRLINGTSEVKLICVKPSPGPYTSQNTILGCDDDCITIGEDLTNDPNGPLTVLWNDGHMASPRTVCLPGPSSYTATYTNNFGCSASAVYGLEKDSCCAPDALIDGPDQFCEGENVILDGSGSDPHDRYVWEIWDAENGWDNRVKLAEEWTIGQQAGVKDLSGFFNFQAGKCYTIILHIQKWCDGVLIN
ncbi:MAG: hypothetical protein JJ975_17635, partial [Bacteroidia bacterium]|nr:hypothetical protein [Bacteroidia bacterium]